MPTPPTPAARAAGIEPAAVATPSLPPLLGLGPAELAPLLGGTGRARRVWTEIVAGRDPFADGVLGDRARQRLRAACAPTVAVVAERRRATCGTTKLLVRLGDHRAVEIVVIPGRGRTTACVSVQVGCAGACRFCVTATMGLERPLGADEIVAQVLLARAEAAANRMPPLRNVVLMGMGEPLDNLAATEAALHLLVHPHAVALPPRHLTTSTVGPSPEAIWAARDLPGCLAWSLHAVDEKLRRRLVPSARFAPAVLRDAFLRVVRHRGDLLFVEMVLVAGENDGLEHARALVDFLVPFQPRVRVNLIAANPGRADCVAPSLERLADYLSVLRQSGTFCMARSARGVEAMAACGQLATAPG
jgi:23S rRNA (adenine2503-C2)-methyltransferase